MLHLEVFFFLLWLLLTVVSHLRNKISPRRDELMACMKEPPLRPATIRDDHRGCKTAQRSGENTGFEAKTPLIKTQAVLFTNLKAFNSSRNLSEPVLSHLYNGGDNIFSSWDSCE